MLSPLVIPYRLTRNYIRSHPTWCFIYGDALVNRSYEGQCEVAKGETNCYMVPTKWNPCGADKPSAFFWDSQRELVIPLIDKAIEAISVDKFEYVVPLPKIGEGRAQMPVKCPGIFRYLRERIDRIASKNITRDYNLLVL